MELLVVVRPRDFDVSIRDWVERGRLPLVIDDSTMP